MPCTIIDNVPYIEINVHPFEKINRRGEYDYLGMLVRVYDRRCQIPPVGDDLTYDIQKDDAEAFIDRTKLPPPKLLYRSVFRFYTRNPQLGDIASDSDVEEENDEHKARGTVAKRRYHMVDHLQLAMTVKTQEAFYAVIQIYLKAGFFVGSQEERATEKAKRNAVFTDA